MNYRSGCLVCMTRQSFVMWNPCVRVTHLMLTLKVWPSHAWAHMCEARRLRCDTRALALAQYSPVICLPHPTHSRSTSSNYCVFVRKSRTRQARSTRGAIKHKSGASGPSPKHLTDALTSLPFLACTHWYASCPLSKTKGSSGIYKRFPLSLLLTRSWFKHNQ